MRVSTPRELGLLVRERRHELRLSQVALASRAGVGREWLVAVEKGHSRAQLGKLLALLAELDLNLDVMLSESAALDFDEHRVDLDALLGGLDDGTR